MKSMLMAAAAAAWMMATPAQAATRQIDFSFGPLVAAFTTAPFGLMAGDTVSGSFTFDDSGFGSAGSYDLQPFLLSFSFSTGTKTWDLGDVTTDSDQIAFDAMGQVVGWSFKLGDPDGEVFASTDATLTITSGSGYIYCVLCSGYQEAPVPVSAIPLPAGFGLLATSLGVLGLRRRKTA